MDIDHHLELPFFFFLKLSKKDDNEAILKAAAQSQKKEKYPELQWTRIFSDGSQTDKVAGAGVYSELFSQYVPAGKFMTTFDAEIYAVHLATNNLIIRVNRYSKVIIFVDSGAAIQAVSLNNHTETPIISQY
ncbi:hypothetical protein CDAR_230111 [Caerostris darwini]|uniref:Uncharacterized protein n=1 Tax=Caerostris darwini TaxID=1538125 RepID=A0AAV4U153_9ARAC|nr:hypothetical protein CDAR_230111 [Caerostris darwini]